MSMFWFGVIVVSVGADLSMHASKSAANAAQKTASINANEKKKAAAQEVTVASENARRKERENQRILASLRATTAANGMQMEGSPLAVFGDTAEQLQRDILDLSFEAENRRRALLVGAQLDTVEGANIAAGMRNEATASGVSSVSGMVVGGAKAGGYLA